VGRILGSFRFSATPFFNKNDLFRSFGQHLNDQVNKPLKSGYSLSKKVLVIIIGGNKIGSACEFSRSYLFLNIFLRVFIMSFNSSAFIPAVIVAILGAVLLSFIEVPLSAAIIFAAGALISGLASSVLAQSSDGKADTTTLYVGNLPYRANEGNVRDLFSEHGKVFSVRLLRDKQTGKRRGFGFVEMAATDSKKAIDALNDFEFQERVLKVRLANEK